MTIYKCLNLKITKSAWLIASVILLALFISACGDSKAQSDEGEEKDTKSGGVITMGTHPVGIAYHSAGAGVAKVISENTSLKMIVSPFTGGTAWTPLLNKGDIEVGITAKPATEWAFNGDYDFKEENKNMRLLVKGNDIVVSGLTVRSDSGIESLKDLKGKRISSGYSGDAIINLIFEAQLKSVGLTMDDVKLVPVADVGQGLTALRENRVDAAFTGTPTVAAFLEADNAVGLKTFNFGNINPSEIETYSEELTQEAQKLVPGIEPVVYKGGFVTEETVMLKYPIALVASSYLSDEDAYEMTKTLWEKYTELHPIFDWLKTWTPETMLDENPLIPYHPGTVQFLKDQGVWTDELEQKQADLMELAQ